MRNDSKTAAAALSAGFLRWGLLASALLLAAAAFNTALAQDSSSEGAESAGENTEAGEPASEAPAEEAPAEEAASGDDASGALPPVETLSADTVVGRVGEKEITHAEVLQAAQELGPQYVQNLSQVYPFLVQRLIDLELVTQAALAAELDDEPAVQERLENARKAVLRDYFLEQKIEEVATEEAVAARYETFLEENPAKQEIKARHILLENEEDAKAVIEALDGGADFAELAKERSTGPSGANGGDLGFFTADMMVPDFSDAAFALEPGSYSAEPVQTQFGWHVILVEETREGAQPPLEEVREQLVAELQTQAVQEMLTELRAAAGVENLRDPDGAMTQN